MKNEYSYYRMIILSILFYCQFFISKKRNIFNASSKNFFFALIIVLITMKIKFNNKFLSLLNSHSYSIYLLQRVIMILFSKKKYFEHNVFINFFIQFLLVILISIIFDKYTIFIKNEKIYKNKKLLKIKYTSINNLITN